MKKLFFILFAVSTICLAQNAAPKIEASETFYDFGDIYEGQIVSHDFLIFNKGNKALHIQKVRASCGCTAAAPSKDELAPGDSAAINVKFDSAHRRGLQKKYVYIFSNDPKNPQYRVSFATRVLKKNQKDIESNKYPKLSVNKNYFDLGNVQEGKVVDVNVKLMNDGKSVLKINDLKTSCGCTAALLDNKNISPDGSADMRIELDTAHRSGRMTRTVSIYSNDPSNPIQIITLSVNVNERES